MSEEIIEDMIEEVAPQIAGDYPEIAQRYKAGEELTDEEERLKNAPLQVEVTRREKKPRPHKKK